MRTYAVRAGDTPASIAAQDSMAGCPKCSTDLIKANPHKQAVVYPNGYTTFASLREGETLNLPDKWFDGSLDTRPPAYFAALPYADGVTPSTLGGAAAGVLGDYATLDEATVLLGTLPAFDDKSFSSAVGQTADLLDSSVQEVTPTAASVMQNTNLARQKNTELAAAVAAGDQAGATAARLAIQNDFSSALAEARIALQSYYGNNPSIPASVQPTSSFPATVVTAAQAAQTAIAADTGYCTSVAHPGSAVNTAIHAFKAAWNGSQNPAVPISTGNYEQATADALSRVLGSAPSACAPHAPPPAPSAPPSSPLLAVTPPATPGLSTAAVAGIALLGAGAVGGAIYLATATPKKRVRRAREFRYDANYDEEEE